MLAHWVQRLTSTYARPDWRPLVGATLVVKPAVASLGRNDGETPDIALAAPGQSRPMMRYETELSKPLHVIAANHDFGTFEHEQAAPAPNRQFRVAMRLPRPDRYHVYAAAVPSGIGQQVMRFERGLQPAPASCRT